MENNKIPFVTESCSDHQRISSIEEFVLRKKVYLNSPIGEFGSRKESCSDYQRISSPRYTKNTSSRTWGIIFSPYYSSINDRPME